MSIPPIVVILGGGSGTGLFPLTKTRSKAAVPVAGKYRLIDISISNCLQSELYHIFVLTQFNSSSLNRHIAQTFQIPPFLDGFVDIRAAAQTQENLNWYQGTADAVRQNLRIIRSNADIIGSEDVLILSGDHLYQMDYRPLLDAHRRDQADVTVAFNPVFEEKAPGLGIAQIDANNRVLRFVEKPQKAELSSLQHSSSHPKNPEKPCFLGSMGIYLFRLSVLEELLAKTRANEFGRDLMPRVASEYRMSAFSFDGYWENIGTIQSYYESMLQLTHPQPVFDFFSQPEKVRFFTRGRSLPSAKINGADLDDALLSEGSILEEGVRITRSLVGGRAFVGKNVLVEDSVLFGCDFYESIQDRMACLTEGRVPLGIGEGSILRRCIVDKNVRIGRNVLLDNPKNVPSFDSELFSIRDGIIVIPKDTVIADNYRLPL